MVKATEVEYYFVMKVVGVQGTVHDKVAGVPLAARSDGGKYTIALFTTAEKARDFVESIGLSLAETMLMRAPLSAIAANCQRTKIAQEAVIDPTKKGGWFPTIVF
jgi:hypothetical protein